MHLRRTVVIALGVTAAASALLTGCEKPAPGATVVSGTTSVHREALCWSFDADRAYTAEDCSVDVTGAPTQDAVIEALADYVETIEVTPGADVGISVDTTVADLGWSVSINGRPLHQELITEPYFRFTVPPAAMRQGSAELQVQAAAEDGSSARGFWVFRLAS